MNPECISGLTESEIFKLILPSGYTFSHAHTVATGLYRKREVEFDRIKGIPKKLVEYLNQRFLTGLFPPVHSEKGSDGTVKYLFMTSDGRKFESVFLPDGKRNTVCISTQSGCRMGCTTCVTARYGFHGDLSVAEILNQLLSIPESASVTHVVFMGMGEPMDNIESVLKACNIISSNRGLSISPGNVTVSTVGIIPGIERFLTESKCNLALSLFSPFPDERRSMAPVENKYPVHAIIRILKNYPPMKKRRFSLAYVMIKDVNDSQKHLDGIKELVYGSDLRINLIPFHPSAEYKMVSSPDDRMMYFKHSLVTSGISASIRKSRGADISAACGLLSSGLTSCPDQ